MKSPSALKVALIEPFYGGSHKLWADGFKKHSQHHITLFTHSAHHWKWRMHGAAITLAEKFLVDKNQFDLIIVSDFLNLPLFKSLIGDRAHIPVVIYFHENQITYPWSPKDQDLKFNRDNPYGFINYSSALVADRILFNSQYHMGEFLTALPTFLGQFPDHTNTKNIQAILDKSAVLPLGMDYTDLDPLHCKKTIKLSAPVILWNHRWEYDKNPDVFFRTLYKLKENKVDFKLIVLGQSLAKIPAIFNEAKQHLRDEILHWGYCESRSEYAHYLWLSDIMPITSIQDFFGISVVEALYCDTIPLFPRRLAYHEHMVGNADEYFYDDDDHLFHKLSAWCESIEALRKTKVDHHVNSYSWTKLIHSYDEALRF